MNRLSFILNTVEALLALLCSRKRPALVTTSSVKPHLNCHLYSVIESSRRQLLLYVTATTFVNYRLGKASFTLNKFLILKVVSISLISDQLAICKDI